jgi:tRNA pseudouridine38-40 synthase
MDGGANGCENGRRIALLLEYDGTAYCGSQYQQNGPSIQSVLEAAINNLTTRTSRVSFAGRTDAGAHALGQIAAFDTDAQHPVAEIARGLNHFLPADVVVRAVREVGHQFDPRRDATSRRYRYRIDNHPQRPAIGRQYGWFVGRRLDLEAMRAAAVTLVGKHDFAAFAPPTDKLTARTLRTCDVSGESGGEIVVEMEAEAFLTHQVRRTVGPLVEIGLDRMDVGELQKLLAAAVPSSAQPAAPPQGLYLVRVNYEGLEFEADVKQEDEKDG